MFSLYQPAIWLVTIVTAAQGILNVVPAGTLPPGDCDESAANYDPSTNSILVICKDKLLRYNIETETTAELDVLPFIAHGRATNDDCGNFFIASTTSTHTNAIAAIFKFHSLNTTLERQYTFPDNHLSSTVNYVVWDKTTKNVHIVTSGQGNSIRTMTLDGTVTIMEEPVVMDSWPTVVWAGDRLNIFTGKGCAFKPEPCDTLPMSYSWKPIKSLEEIPVFEKLFWYGAAAAVGSSVYILGGIHFDINGNNLEYQRLSHYHPDTGLTKLSVNGLPENFATAGVAFVTKLNRLYYFGGVDHANWTPLSDIAYIQLEEPEIRCIRNELQEHPYDTQRFVLCSNGVPQVMDCPAGLHFNVETKQCDWPSCA